MKSKHWIYLGIAVVVMAAIIFLVAGNPTGNSVAVVSGQEVTMYKSPSCGCCVGHAGYLENRGFSVNRVEDQQANYAKKDELGIPNHLRSCHTVIIGDYFVEGHIPIEAINKLLKEQPDIDGIALPAMPAGSPGMPGFKQGDWIIYSVKDGNYEEYMRL